MSTPQPEPGPQVIGVLTATASATVTRACADTACPDFPHEYEVGTHA